MREENLKQQIKLYEDMQRKAKEENERRIQEQRNKWRNIWKNKGEKKKR